MKMRKLLPLLLVITLTICLLCSCEFDINSILDGLKVDVSDETTLAEDETTTAEGETTEKGSETTKKEETTTKKEEETTKKEETTTACQHAQTEQITTTVKEASCTTAGQTKTITQCKACKKELSSKTNTVNALNHTGGTATCQAKATCTRCKQQYGNLASHSYNDGCCKTCGASQDGMVYTLNTAGTGYILSSYGTSTATSVTVRSTYNGKPVVEIGAGAFIGSKATAITVPTSITKIGYKAFSSASPDKGDYVQNNVLLLNSSDWFEPSDLTASANQDFEWKFTVDFANAPYASSDADNQQITLWMDIGNGYGFFSRVQRNKNGNTFKVRVTGQIHNNNWSNDGWSGDWTNEMVNNTMDYNGEQIQISIKRVSASNKLVYTIKNSSGNTLYTGDVSYTGVDLTGNLYRCKYGVEKGSDTYILNGKFAKDGTNFTDVSYTSALGTVKTVSPSITYKGDKNGWNAITKGLDASFIKHNITYEVAGTSEETTAGVLTAVTNIASTAYQNLVNNYYSTSKGYFVDPYKDKNNGMPNGRDMTSDILWVYAQLLLSMETYAYASGDTSFATYAGNEVSAYINHYQKSWLLQCGGGNNPACDDAAWSAMAFMLCYRWTGNTTALEYCHDMIKNAYDYWQDGSTANGLFYNTQNGSTSGTKTLYAVGLVLSELEYYNITKGTAKEDATLHQRTLDLYNWMESHLRRSGQTWNGYKTANDNLYFNDYNENHTASSAPSCYNSPNSISPAGSCSSLFGNTGMAVVNKRLYDMTGDETYKNKAVATANALYTTVYNSNGNIMNDRDAWTNGAFLGLFAREVLPLAGVTNNVRHMFLNTTASIMENAYFVGGYYGADWQGGTRWFKNGQLGIPTYVTVSATTTHMIFATYAALKAGTIVVNDADLTRFENGFSPKAMPQ